MTRLFVQPEHDSTVTLAAMADPTEIAATLAAVGVRFEQWSASKPLGADASSDEVLEAYRADVDRVAAEGGYVSVDVVGMHGEAGNPAWAQQAAEARAKFRAEHTHAEDEVRFFVDGGGAFYLRLDGRVHVVCCEAGDLLSVPVGTRHWFDMGLYPRFRAIRFFQTPEGWVGNFTGDDIATRFPSYDDFVAVPAA
jgi:1,2-dihydroxy-3-keto-5-methylthiopentene dioxygenase